MSTKEILKHLPKLSQRERRAIFRQLLKLESEQGKQKRRGPKKVRYDEVGLLTRNPSFAFLREEPDLYG